MDTKFIMAMLQDKLPNNEAENQVIKEQLDTLDERARDEVALEISTKTTDTYKGILLKELVISALGLVAFYFLIEWQWLGRDMFDDIAYVNIIWRFFYEYYYVIWVVMWIAYIAGLYDMQKEIRKKNFAIISGILYMASHKKSKGV